MKKIGLILVAFLFALFSANASAWDFEGGVGDSYSPVMANGAYYEDGSMFPHSIRTHNFAFELGVTGDVITRANWGLAWHTDFVHLGTVGTDATIDQFDANYNPQTGGCNGTCAGTMTEHAFGTVNGITMTVEPHYDWSGWRLGVEAGPFIFRPTWSDTVYSPNGIFVYSHDPSIQLGAVLGASVSRGNFTLKYQYYFDRTRGGGPAPGMWIGTHLFMLVYRM